MEESPPDHTNVQTLQQIEHSHQRKAAIATGSGTDHAGNVHVTPIANFDLNKTIFSTLEGRLPRLFMQAKIAKKVEWDQADAIRIESEYQQLRASTSIPPVNQNLVIFRPEFSCS